MGRGVAAEGIAGFRELQDVSTQWESCQIAFKGTPRGIKDQYLKLISQRAVTVDYKCTFEVGHVLSLPSQPLSSLMSWQGQKRKEKKQ